MKNNIPLDPYAGRLQSEYLSMLKLQGVACEARMATALKVVHHDEVDCMEYGGSHENLKAVFLPDQPAYPKVAVGLCPKTKGMLAWQVFCLVAESDAEDSKAA